MDLIPGLGRSPGVGNGNSLQYSCLENSMDRGAWWATARGIAESDMTEHAYIHTHQSILCWLPAELLLVNNPPILKAVLRKKIVWNSRVLLSIYYIIFSLWFYFILFYWYLSWFLDFLKFYWYIFQCIFAGCFEVEGYIFKGEGKEGNCKKDDLALLKYVNNVPSLISD